MYLVPTVSFDKFSNNSEILCLLFVKILHNANYEGHYLCSLAE